MSRGRSALLLGVIAAAAVATIVILRKKTPPAEPPVVSYEYEAQFVVTDELEGTPLEGVRVSVAGSGWGLTDANGLVAIDIRTTGDYTFTLEDSEYDLYSGTFTVTGEEA
jgi:hypothetical protein